MLEAAEQNDIMAISDFLKQGGDINASVNEVYETLTSIASAKGHVQLLRNLIDWKADVNRKDKYGHTPLWDAVSYCRTSCVSLLLQAAANPNTSNNVGSTPLYLATWFRNDILVKTLLRYNADPLRTNVNYESPFDLAVVGRDFDLTILYLRYGCKFSQLHKEVQNSAWLGQIIQGKEHCKASFVAFYGIMRKRMRIPLDMVRMLSAFVWDSRFDVETWE